ncbi:MAG: anthranilate phosphoribosyltransferase [Myxococcales bacterium]|nr:anthranilate phosphoribosyltransferase [Myxococcales bacterium]
MIDHLLAGHSLSADQAHTLVHTLTTEDVPDARKAGLLVALRAKGETADELREMARALTAAAVPMDLGAVADTCGTGGDGKHTVNLSTATALVVAAAGHRVAKHGNRSVSSRCGSADVLETLGVRFASDADHAQRQLDATGFTFLFARWFHPAMKAVASARQAVATRTAFNLLGPLVNPARPRVQLMGAFSEECARRLAHALVGLVDRARVVHGHGGYDEATPVGPYVAFDVRDGSVTRVVEDPLQRFGIARCAPEALTGGDASVNAAALSDVFAGRRGAVRDAIVLNATLLLELLGEPEPLKAASNAIDDGRVARLVEALHD